MPIYRITSETHGGPRDFRNLRDLINHVGQTRPDVDQWAIRAPEPTSGPITLDGTTIGVVVPEPLQWSDEAMIDRLARILGDTEGDWRALLGMDACPICLWHGWAGAPPEQAERRDSLAYRLATALAALFNCHVAMPDHDHALDGPDVLCRDCRAAAVYLELVEIHPRSPGEAS